MKKRIIAMFIVALMICNIVPTVAFANVIESGIPSINAKSYMVVEASTGEVLFGENTQEQLAPASITKIMTAILALESGKMDDTVAIGKVPDIVDGSTQVYLRQGEKLPMRQLVEVMVIFSANDAAHAVGAIPIHNLKW